MLSLLVLSLHSQATLPGLWFWGGGDNQSIAEIEQHKDLLQGAKVYYSIGAGSINSTTAEFVPGGNTATVNTLKGKGYEVHAIVGCGSISTLRTLFANPRPFIEGAVAHATAIGLNGYNLDFEPYGPASNLQSGVTNGDGLKYTAFIDEFAAALHGAGLSLSLDYFSNLAIWNLGALNETAIDTLISMDLYVQENNTMEALTEVALGFIAAEKLGVGICPQPSATKKPYGPDPCGPLEWSEAMVKERMQYLLSLMSSPHTAFKMMNVCCAGTMSEPWWQGMGLFYKALASVQQL